VTIQLPPHAAGSTWCECFACGQGFGGMTLFDGHRTGDQGARRCLTAAEMRARGWTQDPRGLWRDLSRGSAPATMPFPARREGANRGVAAETRVIDHRDAERASA
jgi:hypothetical protein